MNFRVGEKVVCVDPVNEWGFILVRGQIYTISKVGMFFSELHVDVIEALTPHSLAWRASRFRPVVERKTDISIFTKILKPETVT
jgi:hypothetical protein